MKTILAVFIMILTFSGIAFAHPPSDVTTRISGTNVNVTVMHNVANPKTHYVKYIAVLVNGERATDRDFASQTDNTTQVASFDIPSLKKDDIVAVEADCSIYGDIKKEFTVE